jgi:saccharopine dehydrogenase-like NADP-dependent oxidoreductase
MKILIIGAGRMGMAIASKLAGVPDYEVELADTTTEATDEARSRGFRSRQLNGSVLHECVEGLEGVDLVVNAGPNRLSATIAQAALLAGTHYIDTAEDNEAVKAITQIGQATSVFLPGCGFSPGLVANIAADLAGVLDGPVDMVVRAGGVPVNPSSAFGYGLSWDVDGLIAEYTGQCQNIVEGKLAEARPLEQHETFVLDGCSYEAFSTAGGLGDLCSALGPKVRNLNFKTIRYPGHLHLARFLFEELGLKRRTDILRTVLKFGVPEIQQDVLVIFISIRGTLAGRPAERAYVRKFYHKPAADGFPGNALNQTSAAHVCAMIDLIRESRVLTAGMLRHESIPYGLISENRFLRHLLIQD